MASLRPKVLTVISVAAFITTKNILDEVKVLDSKLQKRDQDISEAYMMVDEVIKTIQTNRNN